MLLFYVSIKSKISQTIQPLKFDSLMCLGYDNSAYCRLILGGRGVFVQKNLDF